MKTVLTSIRMICLIVLMPAGILSSGAAGGQSTAGQPIRTSVEVDLDFRSQIAPHGSSQNGIYASSLRMTTYLPSDLKFELYGNRKSSSMMSIGGQMGAGQSDFLIQQAIIEKTWRLNSLQAGLIRIPFGIYDYRETYTSGLIDYPMPRLDYGGNSVDWGAPGAKLTTSIPRLTHLQLEVAGFNGIASGVWGNESKLNGGAARLQTYARDTIVGLSQWDGSLMATPAQVSGFDARYTRPHLLIRGEYVFGLLGGKRMHGWYADTFYHLPKYEKWTLAARLEEYKPGANLPNRQQITLGARYTSSPDWIFSFNWRLNNDVGRQSVSWTPNSGPDGQILLQVYRKLGR